MDKQSFINQARALLATYKPNPDVLSRLSSITIFAVVGPTGVGKTTIIESSKVPYVASDVTRAPRAGEQDGKDYYFWTDYAQLLTEIEQGQFVQYTVLPNNEFYGTKISSYPRSGACTMAIVASAIPNFRTLGFGKVVPILIVPPSFEEWSRRMSQHHDLDIRGRMHEALESLSMAVADPEYQYIMNDDIHKACKEFADIVKSGGSHNQQSGAARDVALNLLEQLRGSGV